MAKDGLKFPYKELKRQLDKLGEKEGLEVLKRGMEKTALVYEAEAVKLAPHDKGFLENTSHTQTKIVGGAVQSIIRFLARYAAQVHELPPGRRGPGTRAKPPTKFGSPGPKFLERVLKGMDFEYHAGRIFRDLLKEAAAAARAAKKR